MWRKFRWDMFVTSFLPLWLSIVIVDGWSIVDVGKKTWESYVKFYRNIWNVLVECKLQAITILTLIIVVGLSMRGISKFLKERNAARDTPKGKIVKATKANKLSSEFLLAYILPMIAFKFTDKQDLTLFVVYFAVLAFLCIRNNNIYTNIFLEFKGYKMYQCDIECERIGKKHIYHDSLIISKKDLTQQEGNNLKYWDFENYIYIILDED